MGEAWSPPYLLHSLRVRYHLRSGCTAIHFLVGSSTLKKMYSVLDNENKLIYVYDIKFSPVFGVLE